jgi:hypothetical protein
MNILTKDAQLTIEEAEKLLTADCGKENSHEVFDVYGNYNFPFEEKLITPNTAVGAIGRNY